MRQARFSQSCALTASGGGSRAGDRRGFQGRPRPLGSQAALVGDCPGKRSSARREGPFRGPVGTGSGRFRGSERRAGNGLRPAKPSKRPPASPDGSRLPGAVIRSSLPRRRGPSAVMPVALNGPRRSPGPWPACRRTRAGTSGRAVRCWTSAGRRGHHRDRFQDVPRRAGPEKAPHVQLAGFGPSDRARKRPERLSAARTARFRPPAASRARKSGLRRSCGPLSAVARSRDPVQPAS